MNRDSESTYDRVSFLGYVLRLKVSLHTSLHLIQNIFIFFTISFLYNSHKSLGRDSAPSGFFRRCWHHFLANGFFILKKTSVIRISCPIYICIFSLLNYLLASSIPFPHPPLYITRFTPISLLPSSYNPFPSLLLSTNSLLSLIFLCSFIVYPWPCFLLCCILCISQFL